MDTYMKRLLLFAGALLWCGHIMAGIGVTMPADSVRAKMQIRHATLSVDTASNTTIEKKTSQQVKHSPKPNTSSNATESGNKTTAEEMKNMAKRDKANSKDKQQTPAVSYPYYPGGNVAIRVFVRNNQQYPPECKRERLRGRVEVMIAIAPDGTPHSATISKSSGNVHMDAEALRIAELMPKWQPAPESEDPQGIDYVIFVNFRPGR